MLMPECIRTAPKSRSTRPSLLLLYCDSERTPTMVRKLRRRGYHVVTTGDLNRAHDLMQAYTFDMAVVLSSSSLRGVELLHGLRRPHVVRELPILLLAGSPTVVTSALRAGADDVIVAPFEMALIDKRINTLIDLQRARTERDQALSEAETLHQFNTRLSRMFAHDLRNPLGNIRMAQYMLREVALDEQQSAAIINNVDASLEVMLDVINKFIHALEVQSLDPQIDCVNVGDTLQGVLSDFHAAATRKRITLEQGDESYLAMADSTLLTQVLSNLMSNAIKFSPFDSTVRVSMRLEGSRLRVMIADEGPGIPEDDRPRLFQMFAKLTPRPTNGESSSGLGLWIVQQFMAAQGGQAGVEFPATGGSHFWITLPALDCQDEGV